MPAAPITCRDAWAQQAAPLGDMAGVESAENIMLPEVNKNI